MPNLHEIYNNVRSIDKKLYDNKIMIHSVNSPEIIKPKEDEIISDVDVASLYPSLIIQYEFYPPHLGKAFLDVYKRIKDERIEAKHNGNKLKNLTLKLSINGLSGNLQSPYSFCYSPFTVMQIKFGLAIQKYIE